MDVDQDLHTNDQLSLKLELTASAEKKRNRPALPSVKRKHVFHKLFAENT